MLNNITVSDMLNAIVPISRINKGEAEKFLKKLTQPLVNWII